MTINKIATQKTKNNISKGIILKVKNLSVTYKNKKESVSILKNISFELAENNCLGILGESGSGKSITCKAVMGLLEKNFHTDGEIYFNNKEILNINNKEKNKIRGKDICMIIQNPMTAFNPLFTIKNQVLETLLSHLNIKREEALDLIIKAFKRVNLSDCIKILEKYPHELSGGMLQRIMIALAVSLKPDIIIADEPTTAVDVVNQLEIIKELKRIKEFLNTTIIFISHDLSILSQVADTIIVMKKGEIVETGDTIGIIQNPKHRHTKELIDARFQLINKFKEMAGV